MDEFAACWRVWLRHWHDLCDPDGPPWTDEFSAGGMINDLCNDPGRLKACLAPLPRAEGLTARIIEIIDVAACGQPVEPGLYFVVRDPYPAGNNELVEWTATFYRRCRELTGKPETLPEIRILRCKDPSHAFRTSWAEWDNGPHDALGEWVADLLTERGTLEERAAYYVLREALYKMACDYMLSGFVRWALVEDKVQGRDPYRAQFDLWRSGARDLYHPDKAVRVFAPLNR